jgi:hypothetical protein
LAPLTKAFLETVGLAAKLGKHITPGLGVQEIIEDILEFIEK